MSACRPLYRIAGVFYLLLLSTVTVTAQRDFKYRSLTNTVHWPSFLGRNDMLWSQLPTNWDNAPFVGNGTLGTIFWYNQNKAKWHFEISRGDLYDHRNATNGFSGLHAQCRLPNGHFELGFAGKTAKATGNMRLQLWNATVNGKLQLGTDTIKMSCLTLAHTNVIVLQLEGALIPELQWKPDSAKSTRNASQLKKVPLIAYPAQVVQQIASDTWVSTQNMPESAVYNNQGNGEGQYATAWKVVRVNQQTTRIFISMGFSYPGTTASAEALAAIQQVATLPIEQVLQQHENWWHQYYSKSFVSIPNAVMESYYWIQMYKMASASRQGGPITDLMGPWFRYTSWPAIWWNLNAQLTYWPFYTANHLPEAEPAIQTLWQNKQMLEKNAWPVIGGYAIGRASAPNCASPVGSEVGNLPWMLHNLWLHYRYSMNDTLLKTRVYLLMKGAFKYLQHIVVKQPDGSLTLPKTASPEYTDGVENCNYTIASIRWLANTIIAADKRLHANDTIVPHCQNMLAKLVPYQQDATGFMVGKNMPFVQSHRHWSHLFMMYPFYEYTWENPEQTAIMQLSLQNWVSKSQAFAGFSWMGAASMLAAANRGDEALAFLETFLQKSTLPNTMYREGSPVIETPLAYARTVQEMLLMSHGNLLRIFPGVPAKWTNIAFADLRAEGAFLVSASRKNGVTQFVQIHSLAGEPCLVKTDLGKSIMTKGHRKFKLTNKGNGIVEIDLKKGETVTLYGSKIMATPEVGAVATVGNSNPWGGSVPAMP